MVVLLLDSTAPSAPFVLNPSGGEIWRRLQRNATISDLVRELALEYSVSEDAIAPSVRSFVTELQHGGLVTEA
ncbi:PqqD family protein [Subtercola sp. YIM 133946]|uniref:PqqD family protein n=1 Tax=Subtercola sp. YIM 133946 TaxID=3118909 RepID=UPI002F94D00D